MSFTKEYLSQTIQILNDIDVDCVEAMAIGLAKVRNSNGRLFILGVGGSAGHATHAVNDFRKICELETYTPTDNVCELTARVNDDGWETSFLNWLYGCNLTKYDGVLVLSVGGGSKDKNVSMNIVKSLEFASTLGTKIFGIVGKDGGYTNQVADACVIIPPKYSDRITPHTEGLASVILHLLVTHPALKIGQTKWESVV